MHSVSGFAKIRQLEVLNLYAPLLSVFVHESREHLVVEATHAFATDLKAFAREFGDVFSIHNLKSHFLADNFCKCASVIIALNNLTISIDNKSLVVIVLIAIVYGDYLFSLGIWLVCANL